MSNLLNEKVMVFILRIIAFLLFYYGVVGIKNKKIVYKSGGIVIREFKGKSAIWFGLFWLVAGLVLFLATFYYLF